MRETSRVGCSAKLLHVYFWLRGTYLCYGVPEHLLDATHHGGYFSQIPIKQTWQLRPQRDGDLSEFSGELGCAGILGITRGLLLLTSFYSSASPGPGLAGSVSLALFKVAIICPISRWLRSALRGSGKTLTENPEWGVPRGISPRLVREAGGFISTPLEAFFL